MRSGSSTPSRTHTGTPPCWNAWASDGAARYRRYQPGQLPFADRLYLPALFHKVVLPTVVRDELSHPKAPSVVRNWIASPPAWAEIRQTATYTYDAALAALDVGEEDAIALALELHAAVLLMDDEAGAVVARAKGFEVTGTLGILNRAAKRQLVDLADAFERIKRTNFRYRQDIMDALLAETEAQ